MEVTLKEFFNYDITCSYTGFNPCFNGSDSKSVQILPYSPGCESFNPCFNGSDSKSSLRISQAGHP